MHDVDLTEIPYFDRAHPLGEDRYDLQGTPRAAPGRVTTRWNRSILPPRVQTAASVRWADGQFSPCQTLTGRALQAVQLPLLG